MWKLGFVLLLPVFGTSSCTKETLEALFDIADGMHGTELKEVQEAIFVCAKDLMAQTTPEVPTAVPVPPKVPIPDNSWIRAEFLQNVVMNAAVHLPCLVPSPVSTPACIALKAWYMYNYGSQAWNEAVAWGQTFNIPAASVPVAPYPEPIAV